MIHPALVTPVGWFGQKQDTVLQHSGEGPISAVRWKGPLIAYANDEVYINNLFSINKFFTKCI